MVYRRRLARAHARVSVRARASTGLCRAPAVVPEGRRRLLALGCAELGPLPVAIHMVMSLSSEMGGPGA